jgi:hypothetical protein
LPMIEMIYGHIAGGGVIQKDTKWMEERIVKFISKL